MSASHESPIHSNCFNSGSFSSVTQFGSDVQALELIDSGPKSRNNSIDFDLLRNRTEVKSKEYLSKILSWIENFIVEVPGQREKI